ncbi:HAD-IIA family hydrolase [Janibacter melonis]|uniref:HAD-IIA family hydrolase n=1 Tax=Janibacter melonis TaxID=262209 RepID=A0A5P8FLF5_9MICO|nr:HAD-IIA family hydrolase [Janibacter melonis]QFQ30013.2 HAD-IIA family hydrolase [Janibacter melonis]
MTDARPLVERYDALICDLDGVVYKGAVAVPHAVDVLESLRQPVVYATNNASRTPADVAAHLRELGLSALDDAVVTSSTAAAGVLAAELDPGALVLAVGGPGVSDALTAAGLVPVAPSARAGRHVAAVVQGYGPDVTAADLAEAAYAIQDGARWVATNVDRTLPTDRGVAPGNGSLVGAVRLAVDVEPEVMGKPAAPMYTIAARSLEISPDRVLAVGDRLETDLGGAVAAGTAGLLVLTGVHGWADAAAAGPSTRPDHVVEDLRGLLEPYPYGRVEDGRHHRGSAMAAVHGGELHVEGDGVDALRAALDAIWAARDAGASEQWCRDSMAELVGTAG